MRGRAPVGGSRMRGYWGLVIGPSLLGPGSCIGQDSRSWSAHTSRSRGHRPPSRMATYSIGATHWGTCIGARFLSQIGAWSQWGRPKRGGQARSPGCVAGMGGQVKSKSNQNIKWAPRPDWATRNHRGPNLPGSGGAQAVKGLTPHSRALFHEPRVVTRARREET